MSNRIFIHANNVHQGGGRTLLLSLLDAVTGSGDWFATLDSRLQPLKQVRNTERVKWVARSMFSRLFSEFWLFRKVCAEDLLLCFGNLPPLFRSRGRSVVFLQSRYLIEKIDLAGFTRQARFRIYLERLWFAMRAKNANLFVVQTPTMQRILEAQLAGTVATVVLPFTREGGSCIRRLLESECSDRVRFDFVYVASGEPHKNHCTLIQAWCLLAKAGQFPSLCLTIDVDAFPALCHWIDERASLYGLRVTNLGAISQDDVKLLYKQVSALIFPSKLESFGLPLNEARQAGLPILAPELDYVRDILDPEEVFDPNSPMSIARSVRRHLGIDEANLPLLNAVQFVEAIRLALKPKSR